jgi:hypothetical protein
MYLLFNVTTPELVTTLDASDAWESMMLPVNDSSTTTISAHLTLCMTTFEVQDLEIHTTRPAKPYREPKPSCNTYTA